MIHSARITTILLAGLAALGSSAALARPHSPPPAWRDPAGPPTEMDVWLRRLAGRFIYEGTLDRSPGEIPEDPTLQPPNLTPVKGLGDCIGIGTGSGIHCVIYVTWPEPLGLDPADPEFVAGLDPAMILYGIDPGNSQLTYLQVNAKGLAEGGAGVVTGNSVRFRAPCTNTGSGTASGAAAAAAVNSGRPPPAAAPAPTPPPPASGDDPNAPPPGSDEGPMIDSGDTGADDLSSPMVPEAPDLFGACERITYITAKPDRNSIEVRIDIGDRMQPSYSFVLVMRRVSDFEASNRPGRPAGQQQR